MELHLPADQDFKTKPLKHQLECLLQSRHLTNFAIFAEMGCGKSKILIDTAAYLFSGGKINGLVVICPKSVSLSWVEQQIPTHMPDTIRTRIVTWGSQSKALNQLLKRNECAEPGFLHILIMNVDAVITDRGYDALHAFLTGHNTLLAVDESTSIKNPKASRTKMLIKLGLSAKYRRILTGTPIANRPLDVFSQFKFLQDGCLGISSWLAFRNRYALTVTRYVNGRHFEEIIGWQRLDELQQTISKLSYRVLKKDCLDLPPKIYQTRYIELSPEQKKYYNELREKSLTELASGTLVATPLIITRVLRLRQALCNLAPTGPDQIEPITKNDPRLNEVISLIEEAGDQKIIIWASFVPSVLNLVEAINKEFGEGKAAAFYGDVDPKGRQSLIDRFQDQKSGLQVLVIRHGTGDEGITLTAAELVIYYSNEWSLKTRLQTEDRAHRIGQTKAVTYVDIIAKGTHDEYITASLQNKKEIAGEVTGDSLRQILSGVQ